MTQNGFACAASSRRSFDMDPMFLDTIVVGGGVVGLVVLILIIVLIVRVL